MDRVKEAHDIWTRDVAYYSEKFRKYMGETEKEGSEKMIE
jgi:hypothetical protein